VTAVAIITVQKTRVAPALSAPAVAAATRSRVTQLVAQASCLLRRSKQAGSLR